MSVVIQVENLSKYYRLGVIGSGTLTEDVNRWIARLRARPDPRLKVGEVDHGNREAGQVWALNGLDLEVRQGEVLGVIGSNGAGKSTLLKILSRITAPTAGRARIRGRVGSLLEVGTGFHAELTGRENTYLNGTILGMSHAEVSRKLDEIVDFAEITDFIDTPVKRYSSGMTVRLAFAVAAHLEPEILIIDEVLAVGDAAFRKKCLGKMKDVAGQGRTVLYVSHNMSSVENLCSRAVMLRSGKIASEGNTKDVITDYLRQSEAVREIGLSDRVDRQGSGVFRFRDVELLDEHGYPVNTLVSGRDYRIRLHYKGDPRALTAIQVAVGINDIFGTRLATLDSDMLGGRLDLSTCKGAYVDMLVDRFPLNEGSYTLTLFSRASDEIADWIHHVTEFTVLAGDFFGTGKTSTVANGVYLINHRVERPE